MSNFIQTRIIPPALSHGIIKRERLLLKINENIKKSLILICAPAGYGKTTLIRDFLLEYYPKSSWLQVRSDIDNFYTFISYLTHSLQQLNPEFGKGTLAVIDDYREKFQLSKNLKRIVSDIISTFLNEFCKCFDEDIVVVIDDLGNIENSEWLSTAFNIIFENIPSNMHIVITSRDVPDFNLSVLKAKRNILKIESKDLTFNTDEIDELLRNVYSIKCSENEIDILRNNLSGWITGIHLILQSYGRDFPKLRLDKIIIFEDIFNYFTEDIFNNLDDNVREFLLNTSLLESFSIDLCNELFETTKSKQIINKLLSKNIFIQINSPLPDEIDPNYSYQMLFKRFLNLKLNELKTKEEIKKFYKKVSKYYLNRNEHLQAITYALNAEDYETAVTMIEKHFQYYFDNGNFEIIWKWLECLNESTLEQNANLLYFKSLLMKFYEGNIEESIPYLNKAIAHAKKQKDKELLTKCYLWKSRNLISLGKISEAIKNINEILSQKTSSENKAKLLYLMAFAHYQNSDYDKSLPLLDKAVKELEEEELIIEGKDIQIDIFKLYGHIYLIRGEFAKSISYYEKVDKKADKIIDKQETYCNLILLYSLSGKFDKAVGYNAKAKETIDRISIPIFKITYLLAYQALKFEFGDYEDSIRLLEEMNDIAVKLNHKYYIYLSYSLIGDSYYYLNKLSKTEEYYDLAFKYVNDDSSLEKIQYSVMKALLLKKMELNESVEQVLLEAYEYYKKNKIIYNQTQVAFHLADYYARTNNLQNVYKYISGTLNIAQEKDYISFLQRDFPDSRYLFDFAIANNIQKDFIKLLADSLLNKKDTEWISDQSRKRIIESSDSVYDIMLNSFGKGDVTVRGEKIEENEWSKKKWKLIFIYLLLNSKRELTKDKIIDMFYPDTPLESVNNIFHQIVSKFRNLIKIDSAINPDNSKNRAKKSILGELKLAAPLIIYEDKILRLNYDFNFYIDSNEFEKYYKLVSTEKDKDKKLIYLKKAINFYKGDFLEGNYDNWCEELRTKYKSYLVSMSEELIKLLYFEGDYTGTLNYCENLLKYEKLNLVSYEYTIKSYENLDKHKLAREKYSQLIKNYKIEYDESVPNYFTEKIKFILN